MAEIYPPQVDELRNRNRSTFYTISFSLQTQPIFIPHLYAYIHSCVINRCGVIRLIKKPLEESLNVTGYRRSNLPFEESILYSMNASYVFTHNIVYIDSHNIPNTILPP
jgi:hypothetical protein